MSIKIWVDDVRPAPKGYYHAYSVNQAINLISAFSSFWSEEYIDLIDIDHDAGDYASDGGDYIKLLDWLEKTNRNIPIRLHTMNPVGRENMRRIIAKNGWVEVFEGCNGREQKENTIEDWEAFWRDL